MNKSLIAGALMSLPVAACAPGTAFIIPGTSITIDPTTVAADVAGLCAYRVEIQDIAALLSSSPFFGTANAVAALICSNISAQVIATPVVPPVTPAASARRMRHGAAPPSAVAGAVVLNGVILHYSR